MTGYRIEATDVSGLPAWVLHDDANQLNTTWVPDAGMLGASLIHRDQELLWQGAGVGAYASDRTFMGIPFLHPWANRLDGFRYRTGGHDVVLDPDSPVLLLDDNGLPIHGVLNASRGWSVHEVAAGGDRACLIARLEFDQPQWLEAFPFRHRVEMRVELGSGALQVRTTLTATGDEAVPVAFGFHPYLQLPGLPRAKWTVSFPVRRWLAHDKRLIPTGVTEPASPITGPIGNRTWDDGFDRVEEPARFTLHGGGRTIEVGFGPGFPIGQIFAPPEQEYVCIEPMTAPANALAGPDQKLAWVPPGEQRSAAFWIACSLGP